MTTKVNERALVLEMLLAVNEEGQYSHLVLRDVLDKYQYLGKQERAFLTRLMEGTLERQLTLDYVIDQFSKTRVKKMKPLIRNLMRMSVYQIMYMDSVPDSAVCNEAVKLARKRGFSGLSGFVNGVLRSVARGWREVRFPNLSVTYSMPEWIVDIWTENYGEEKTRQILEGLTAENRLTIRTNLSAVTPEELVNKLKSEGVTVHAVPELPYAFEISGLDYLAGLKSISCDIREAAVMDGANAWQRFTRVTLPLLMPSIRINVVTNIIGSLSVFDIIMALTEGGPGYSTESLSIYIMRMCYGSRTGYSTAVAMILFLIVLLPVLISLRLTRGKE